MEAVGRLATGIAHDFNNLLTAILGYGAIVRSSVAADAVVSEDVDELLKAAERARSLTQQLLAFSRKQDAQPRVVSLNDLIRNLHAMLRRLVREDVQIKLVLQDDIRPVTVDPTQIEQVIINLTVNACDAMPNGGTLTIATSDARSSSGVELAVSDTGCGIDESTRARMFEPFFTTKEPGQGTGLGLSVVHDIVQEALGTISVESERGHGSTFSLRVPASAAPLPCAAAPATAFAVGEGETVLLVEDEEPLRLLTARILRGAGYRVLEAVDGEDAVHRSQQYDGSVDLLVTDVVMPKVGGVELARHLARDRPAMRVIYMSGYSRTSIARQDDLADGAAWLSKPFSPYEFLSEVRASLKSTRSAAT